MTRNHPEEMLKNCSTHDHLAQGQGLRFEMPSPERIQHFNKESAKVNSGMLFASADVSGEDATNAWQSNTPPVGIDFSIFAVPPSVTAPEKLSTEELVRRLLNPPPHAFFHGILSINWVVGAVGKEHFVHREVDGRLVLTRASELRMKGGKMGLPGAYHGWLCGDDMEISATEEGIVLTPQFFEKEVEREGEE